MSIIRCVQFPLIGTICRAQPHLILMKMGVKELVLTQPVLDMILNEGGFLCVGHGYFVDMIAVM